MQGPWRVVPPPDDIGPTVQATTFGGGSDGKLQLGDDTVHIQLQSADNIALRSIGYELRGASLGLGVVHRDSVLVSANDVTVLDDTLSFPLPLSLANLVPPHSPNPMMLTGSAFARDTAGNGAGASIMPFEIHYPDPPVVTASVTGASRPDTVGALRDTLDITVTASAPRELRYIGYRATTFTNVADSVAVTALTATHTFRLPVPFAWKGLLLRIEIFARDRLGLQDQEQIAELRVVVLPSRPTQSLRVGQGVSDLLYDDVRRRVYLMTALDTTPQAGRPEVRVYDFATAAFVQPGIALPWQSGAVEVLPGGDSLLVSRFNGLGLIDLTTLATDSTDFTVFPPPGRGAGFLRTMANGKTLVSIAAPATGGAGAMVEYQVAPGSQTVRSDVGSGGDVGSAPWLGRTPDRTRMLLYSSHTTASQAQLYMSATDAFGPSVAIPAPPFGFGSLSASADGSRWLVGNQLLDGALTSLRQLGTSIYGSASVLSPDGVYAYVSTAEGVWKYRTADGAGVELILLQEPPYRLTITPDGNTLIAVGFGLQIVDLR
jgi:hypothetical protein